VFAEKTSFGECCTMFVRFCVGIAMTYSIEIGDDGKVTKTTSMIERGSKRR